jgi:Asp-tRNA(Asn)/Glu-tRNA(Gln) amidotransferase A subunit family amidase
MPTNPVALDRIPDGSSSSSVVAGFVDFSLGEDFIFFFEKKLKIYMPFK